MGEPWKKAKLLIWGTTYPEFSKTYYETVCTGAVDEATGRLVRIYPITMRYQKEPFGHYNWIETQIQRNPDDRRPESFRIQQEDIKVGEKLDTKQGWAKRSQWILRPGNVFESVESLWKAQEADRTSLGLIKPRRVKRVYVKKLPAEERKAWNEQREKALKQKDLYVDADTRTKDLVFMPVRYRVQFECHDQACKGHDMSVLDWGIYVLSRRQFRQKGKAKAEADVMDRIKEILDPDKKDAYLFLGNTKAHPMSFMIVGFYYPPKASAKHAGTSSQQGLPGIE